MDDLLEAKPTSYPKAASKEGHRQATSGSLEVLGK
jgi:hypothetical protein